MVPKKWNTERKWCEPHISLKNLPHNLFFPYYLPKIIPFPINCIYWPSSIWGSILSKLFKKWKYSKGVMGKRVFTEWVWEWYLEESWYFRDDSEPPLIRNIGVKRIAEKSPTTTSLNWKWGYFHHFAEWGGCEEFWKAGCEVLEYLSAGILTRRLVIEQFQSELSLWQW